MAKRLLTDLVSVAKFLLPLFVFILTAGFVSATEDINLKDTTPKYVSMIQQVLQEENKTFFFPRAMRLDLLKNCLQAIPTLAQWIYDEWHHYDASLTKERLLHSFATRLNSDEIPITFIVLKKDMPIGVISIKKETAPEFSDFPENSIWMGTLYVIPEERNQGVDQELLKVSQIVASQLGYEKLHLYISNPTYLNWYLQRGAQVIEERPFRNHTITIMEFPLQKAVNFYHSHSTF